MWSFWKSWSSLSVRSVIGEPSLLGQVPSWPQQRSKPISSCFLFPEHCGLTVTHGTGIFVNKKQKRPFYLPPPLPQGRSTLYISWTSTLQSTGHPRALREERLVNHGGEIQDAVATLGSFGLIGSAYRCHTDHRYVDLEWNGVFLLLLLGCFFLIQNFTLNVVINYSKSVNKQISVCWIFTRVYYNVQRWKDHLVGKSSLDG